MKSDLLGKQTRHFRFNNLELLLTCLAFLLGVVSYIIIKPSFPITGNGAYSIANLDYRLFGCIILLFMLQLSAFSAVGTIILPGLNFAFGLFLSMTLASIMPADKLSVYFIIKVFFVVLLFVFSGVALSCSAGASSKRFYGRVRSDKRFRMELIKTLVLSILFVILSVLGLSDINMIF